MTPHDLPVVERKASPFVRIEMLVESSGSFAGLFRACGIPEEQLAQVKSIQFIPVKKKRKRKTS